LIPATLYLVTFAATLSSSTPADTTRARITYLMGTTVYLDAGRDEGLVEGHEIRVVRAGQRIALLRVTSLA